MEQYQWSKINCKSANKVIYFEHLEVVRYGWLGFKTSRTKLVRSQHIIDNDLYINPMESK